MRNATRYDRYTYRDPWRPLRITNTEAENSGCRVFSGQNGAPRRLPCDPATSPALGPTTSATAGSGGFATFAGVLAAFLFTATFIGAFFAAFLATTFFVVAFVGAAFS